jgi:hypothetical protein
MQPTFSSLVLLVDTRRPNLQHFGCNVPVVMNEPSLDPVWRRLLTNARLMAAIRALRSSWNLSPEEEYMEGQQEIFFAEPVTGMRQLHGPFWQPSFGTPTPYNISHVTTLRNLQTWWTPRLTNSLAWALSSCHTGMSNDM